MLANTRKANQEVMSIIKEWEDQRMKKFHCGQCKYNDEPHVACQDCQEEFDKIQEDDPEMKQLRMMEIKYDCNDCGRGWRDRMEED